MVHKPPRSAGEPLLVRVVMHFPPQTPHLLAQDRGVVPGEAQFRVGGKAAERLQERRRAFVVVKKDVPLRVLDQRQNVHAALHGNYPSLWYATRSRPSLPPGRRAERPSVVAA